MSYTASTVDSPPPFCPLAIPSQYSHQPSTIHHAAPTPLHQTRPIHPPLPPRWHHLCHGLDGLHQRPYPSNCSLSYLAHLCLLSLCPSCAPLRNTHPTNSSTGLTLFLCTLFPRHKGPGHSRHPLCLLTHIPVGRCIAWMPFLIFVPFTFSDPLPPLWKRRREYFKDLLTVRSGRRGESVRIRMWRWWNKGMRQ